MSLPTVTTSQVTNIQQTTATGGGNVTNAGGGTVTDRGICWSTSHNPTTNGSHVSGGQGLGSFSCNMTGLTAGTTYYVRAYAVNSAGTAYGNEESFETLPNVSLPTVTTSQVTNIQQTTATGGGNVTSDGGGTVTDRGICWSTSHNPNTNNSHVQASTGGAGSFTCNMTGLTAGTTYYVRAYAVNSAGTAYGNEVSFVTLQNPPTVSTVQITNVTQTSATATATVTSGNNVTERGVCWSTSHNPTTTNGSHASSGSGTGTFSVNITGLTPGTTYYVRAYAINNVGTAYGSEVSFPTLSITIPTVTTSQVTNITQTSASGGGNVTDTGGASVTERGLCWGMNPNPTTSGTHQSNGNGTGAFTVEMTNLTPDTTYYVRAYAVNSVGTAYGNEVHFQTSDLPFYDITVIADPPEGGAVSGEDTYQQGQTCTVTAMANPGYAFINWTKNNVEVSTNASYTFTVSETAAYIAHFRALTYTVNVTSNPENGGIVSTNSDSYTYGQECIVTAIANAGYTFTNWTENGEMVSEEDQYTFIVERDYNLVANFSTTTYFIAAVAEPNEGGIVTGYGEYAYNAEAVLQATANEGYSFVKWTENGTIVHAEEQYNFRVTSNRNLEANFTLIKYTITTTSSPTEGGSVSVNYNEAAPGTVITITIDENDGYELDTITAYKTNNHLQTIPVSNYLFTMPNYPVTVKGEFKQKTLEINPPAPICSGESLNLTEPWTPWAQHGYWQLSQTEAFDPDNTITYTDQTLDVSYNGWFLRYHVQIGDLEWNSNIVQITVNSLDGLTLQGDESVSIDQEVEYRLMIEGQNNYTDYSYNWIVSDGQANITIDDNSCKVIWESIGIQQVSVIVTDNTTGCINDHSLDVNVTSCIDNLQEIVAKTHTEGNDKYTLILVYPNPNDEEYEYQWQFSTDSLHFSDLHEGTYNKQYYYKGGRLKEGYYRVRVTQGECSVETGPYHVMYSGNTIRIYPNPSRRGNSIVVVNDCDGPAQLNIYSTDGRLLHTQTVIGTQATVNISLPSGVYIAYLTNSEGYTKVGKLIIQ